MSGQLSRLVENDRWIPLLLVGVFVGFVSVMGVFAYIAVSTHPELVTDRPYERGLRYDEVLEAEARQKALGWTMEVRFDGPAGEPRPLEVRLLDRAGLAITGAELGVLAERPARHAQAIPIPLKAAGGGLYAADVTLPLGGRWILRVTAFKGEDRFQQIEEVVIAGSRTP